MIFLFLTSLIYFGSWVLQLFGMIFIRKGLPDPAFRPVFS